MPCGIALKKAQGHLTFYFYLVTSEAVTKKLIAVFDVALVATAALVWQPALVELSVPYNGKDC